MRALKSLDLGQERVDADVGEVEDLVGDGLVRAEAGVVPVSLEDGREDDVDREPLVPLLLEDVPAQLEVLGAVVREHADQGLLRRLVDGTQEALKCHITRSLQFMLLGFSGLKFPWGPNTYRQSP